MKKLIIASTSTLYKGTYLAYLLPVFSSFFKKVKTVVFIPYARPGGISYDAYTTHVKKAFDNINVDIMGLHTFENPKEAIQNAEGIFTGGGNTFELVNQLYEKDIMEDLKVAINRGTPYLGTSAGSNICGLTIVYPPGFETLGCIPFNINPHYLDPDLSSQHMGETRETRIKEFHVFHKICVLGLREGSWLEVTGNRIILKGTLTARWFQPGKEPIEIAPNVEIDCSER